MGVVEREREIFAVGKIIIWHRYATHVSVNTISTSINTTTT
jgi:hypothetical protein